MARNFFRELSMVFSRGGKKYFSIITDDRHVETGTSGTTKLTGQFESELEQISIISPSDEYKTHRQLLICRDFKLSIFNGLCKVPTSEIIRIHRNSYKTKDATPV